MKTPASISRLPTPTSDDMHPGDIDLEAPAPTPPAGLTKDAKHWWTDIQDEFSIDDPAGLLLLQTAMTAFDRMKQAAATIKKDGAVVVDRFGQQRAHPAVTTERDSRAGMLAALRALNLDVIPNRDAPGRPPGT